MIFKVLIIDDEYINRRLLSSFLKKGLYQVEILESVDGNHGLDMCRQHLDIQLILLDVEMPQMDGSEFLKAYKKEKNLPNIPIIAVSSNDLRIKEIRELGANAYLVKPVTEEKLLNSIVESQSA